MRLIFAALTCCTLGTTAIGQTGQPDFNGDATMAFCQSKHSNTQRMWECLGEARRAHADWSELPRTHNGQTAELLKIGMKHCEQRWAPDWAMVLHCSKGQLGPAMRLSTTDGFDPARVAQCVRRHSGDLTAAEFCAR